MACGPKCPSHTHTHSRTLTTRGVTWSGVNAGTTQIKGKQSPRPAQSASTFCSQDTPKFLHNAVWGKVLPLRIINLVSFVCVCVEVSVCVWGCCVCCKCEAECDNTHVVTTYTERMCCVSGLFLHFPNSFHFNPNSAWNLLFSTGLQVFGDLIDCLIDVVRTV